MAVVAISSDNSCMKLLTIALLLFIANMAHSQVSDSLIYWGTREVVWSDFKGQPKDMGETVAMTSIEMGCRSASTKADTVILDVYCAFRLYYSWTKLQTAEILRHEQKHFDIGEMYMRILRSRILQERFTYQNLNSKLKILKEEAQMGFNVYSDQYDRETSHSKNVIKQKEWEARIAKELADLSAYSNRIIKIKVYRQ